MKPTTSKRNVTLCAPAHTGLPANVQRDERLPRRYTASPADVFCLVKHELCDEDLMQPALLVYPGDESAQTRAFWQTSVQHEGIRTEVDSERAEGLLDLCSALEKYPQYGRAIAYMRSLAGQGSRARFDACLLDFIAAGGQAPNAIAGILPQRPARPDAHRLNVRFHRR